MTYNINPINYEQIRAENLIYEWMCIVQFQFSIINVNSWNKKN